MPALSSTLAAIPFWEELESTGWTWSARRSIEDTTPTGFTVLMHAARNAPHLLPWLQGLGMEVSEIEMAGLTAVHWAVLEYAHNPVIATKALHVLTSLGASLDQTAHFMGTPLQVALSVSEPGSLVDLLLTLGASLEGKDGEGMTPLLWTLYKNRPALFSMLLKKGADVNATDNEGKDALLHAVRCPGAIPSLLDMGFGKTGPDGITPYWDYAAPYLKSITPAGITHLQHARAVIEAAELGHQLPDARQADSPVTARATRRL
jgi:hypothetical protein